jgi:hypothetical protein
MSDADAERRGRGGACYSNGMYAKSVVYDKERIAEQNGLPGPVEVFTFGPRKYDVRAYRFIRVEWETERVFGNNTGTDELWVVLTPIEAGTDAP